MTLGVVIPVYRGGESVGSVVEALARYARERELRCRVVLVEDGSGGASREAVQTLANGRPGVTALLLPENVGQQRALWLGIRHLADCDVIATMDQDGAHPVALLDEMLRRIHEGAQVCYAVARRRRYPLHRRLGALARDMLFALCLGARDGARVGAYRVMTRALARQLQPEPDGYIYLSAAALALKPTVACVRYEAGAGAQPSTYTLPALLRMYGGLATHYTPLKAFRRRGACAEPCAYETVAGRGWLWQP
ncbi:MAG: glycosyltransferase [Clostridiales bacterium]|nr:glycosyltransferase [Clostridiales bacterium]